MFNKQQRQSPRPRPEFHTYTIPVPYDLLNLSTTKATAIVFLAILLILASITVKAKTQSLELKTGWNLVSFSVEPTNKAVTSVFDSVIQSGQFESVWTYDGVNEKWLAYPTAVPGIAVINTIEVGKGYWVKVTSSVILEVAGADSLASGELELTSGWNLVGFPLDSPKEYSFFLAGVPLTQIWTYDSDTGEFKGVEFAAGTSTTIREDFTKIEPGRAYWIYSGEAHTLGPILGTSMEGDKDVSPFRDQGPPGTQIPWSPFSQGDEDIGGDGFFDTPTTQRALTFRDVAETKWIYISNIGNGVLNYSAEIIDHELNPWVRLLEFDENEGKDVRVVSTEGSVSTTAIRLRLVADRTRMIPGHYTASLRITSNGHVDHEPERLITIHLDVAAIEGDYKLIAYIDKINGKKADMPNPRYFLSLYKDSDDPQDVNIKGIIDENKSLLMPNRFYMAGQYYETQSNNFIVSGSFVLPAKVQGTGNQELNPYQVELRRDIILIGDRKSADDHGLGPLDLKGEYRETIINVLKEPIYLSGTFVAYRTNKKASALDTITKLVFGNPIPDGTAYLEKVFTVAENERVLITEVDISPTIVHERPSDLVMTLTSPGNTTVTLRDRVDGDTGKVTYDEDTEPLDSMDAFIGEKSPGDWILKITDTEPEKAGELVACSLDIKGTRVYSVRGKLLNVPAGTEINLSGCGISRTAIVDADGSFFFDDLIDCNYEIIFLDQGYNPIYLRLTVDGKDLVLEPITPEKVQSLQPDFVIGPALEGQIPFDIVLTDITTLDPAYNYSYDWTVVKTSENPTTSVLLDDQLQRATHSINTAGIYQVEMKIFQLPDRTTPIHTILKSEKIVAHEPPQPGANRLMFVSTAGGGGIPNGRQEFAYDSATFDIDRYPLVSGGAPIGGEDSEVFGFNLNLITKTNQIILDGDIPVGNGKIDPPVGANSKRIYVHIGMGQPFIGSGTAGGLKLSAGGKP